MTTNQLKKFLKLSGACSSGRDWVQRQIKKGKSPKEIWESCKNNDYKYWMGLKLCVIDVFDYYDYRVENNLQYYSMSDKAGENIV